MFLLLEHYCLQRLM